MPGSEAARALSEVSHLRQVVRHLRGLLLAAAAAERRAEEATEQSESVR
jgi:hypothetical protein